MIELPRTEAEFTQFVLQYSGRTDSTWSLIEEYTYTDDAREWSHIQRTLHSWIDWVISHRPELVTYRIFIGSHRWQTNSLRRVRIWVSDISIDELVFTEKFYYQYKHSNGATPSCWGSRYDDIVNRCRVKVL